MCGKEGGNVLCTLNFILSPQELEKTEGAIKNDTTETLATLSEINIKYYIPMI
jgi:hypothetical protein